MYALTDRLLIVAPKRTNVRDLLLRYSSLFGIVIAGTLAVFAIVPLLSSQAFTGSSPPHDRPVLNRGPGCMRQKLLVPNAVAPASPLDPALAFFLGGVLVIGVLLCYEAWLWKTRR